MPHKNKPLLLRPSGKDYLWGGSRLNDEFENLCRKQLLDRFLKEYN